MDEEELDGVLKDRGKKNKNSMSGIGTRVTVRIPEERGEGGPEHV